MSKRTTILLPDELYERLERRAHRRGVTVSEEIREALDCACADENPNRGWLELSGLIKEPLPGPPIDSDEFKDEYARAVYRDSFNREPDW
jgi:hypothetical protein